MKTSYSLFLLLLVLSHFSVAAELVCEDSALEAVSDYLSSSAVDFDFDGETYLWVKNDRFSSGLEFYEIEFMAPYIGDEYIFQVELDPKKDCRVLNLQTDLD